MKFISLFAVAALAAGIVAQGSKPKPKPAPKAPTSLHCAVMAGNKVDIAKATKTGMYSDYKGKRYFFCCGGCPAAFKANPAKYAKADSIPTPKTK